MNVWKSTKVYTAFLFLWAIECTLKREHSRQSELIEMKHFKLLFKENNGQFAKNRSQNEGITFQRT